MNLIEKNFELLSKTLESNQTNKICALAININPNALQFVRNQTNELCHLALTKDVHTIKFVKNLDINICVNALRRDESVVVHIKDYIRNYGKEFNLK